MIGIYKIENKLNGKIYIGQALDINLRIEQHKDALKTSLNSWYPLARKESNSIDDFDFTILQTCKPEELDELESYWIKHYDSYENGYNKTRDGQYLQGKKIVDLTALTNKNISNEQIFQFMREMNGNAFKLWLYFIIKSKTQRIIAYSSSSINSAVGICDHSSLRNTIKELIKLNYISEIKEGYIINL